MRTEVYVPQGGMEEKVREWLSKLDRKRRWPSGPERPALLVLDMQRFFTGPESHAFIPASREIIPVISNIVEKFKGPIFKTRHIQPEDAGNLMTLWWRDRVRGELSEMDAGISGIKGEIIRKEHYSAFHDTGLDRILNELDVGSVIVTGVMTELCCETTARDAFMRGFKVFFIADGTATSTEEKHMSSLKAISHGFGEVISSKELMSRL
ncbi:MAG: isochorismatase family protein [Candidatus Thermoplasmatota archaeon]|nr:isochorismatase family protein [Candidatus Thermoplasmatota archaeon]